MKKSYTTPHLTVHGGIEEITNAVVPSSSEDTIFGNDGQPTTVVGGIDVGQTTGSLDLCTTSDDVNCLL